ncbi:MAG: hypothetical protein WBI38_06210, partial [Bacillota bacterium]
SWPVRRPSLCSSSESYVLGIISILQAGDFDEILRESCLVRKDLGGVCVELSTDRGFAARLQSSPSGAGRSL